MATLMEPALDQSELAVTEVFRFTPRERPSTMRAVVQDTYGAADVLQLRTLPRPEIRNDEVLIRVHAAGVDRGVWHLMTGEPYLVRLAFGLRAPKRAVPGMDIAGRVIAVGAAVTRFQAGDEVFGVANGSFAEYASAHEDKLAPKPANLTFEHAAAVPVSAATALRALRDQGRVQPGQRVLIVGASGGVGTYAVQLAIASGAQVTGVCGPAKVDLVRSLGVDQVLDHTRDHLASLDQHYDLILDIGGSRPLSHLRKCLTPRGTLVLVGGEGTGRWFGGMGRRLQALILSWFTRHTLRVFIARDHYQDLLDLTELIEADKVTPVIDRIVPLSAVPAAMQALEDGQVRGKIVITLDASSD